ncbi:MAG: Rrf2 family transcriptional regulator [Eubacteriales bacterium]|nr:Rrf2 family transcriptional regulator [Eubacteriales bacterium]
MTGTFALAVHALVYLHHKNTTLSSEALAENICTNPARVRKVMAQLKKAGLVSTKEGSEGGYTPLGDTARVTLAQVAEAVDASFVSAVWRPGSVDMNCLVASGMAGVLDGIYADLDMLCKQRLRQLTIGDLEKQIFSGRTPGKEE